jgi:predicted O-methyltransferase YrrM
VSVLVHFIKWRLGLAPAEVWTTARERACLARHVAGKRKVVEIGVWHGGTSKGLRSAMADDGVLFAVDPYEPGRLGFSIPRIVGRAEVARVRRGEVDWIRQTGQEAAASDHMRRQAPFDFVFIDAAQTRERLEEEWRAWSPLIAPDGIIAVHDSLTPPDSAGPEQTSVECAREIVFADQRFELIETVDSLSVLKRRAVL